MGAEEVHREKLKQLGYKDEAIAKLVNKYIANCTYEFAEAYHAEQLILSGFLRSCACKPKDEKINESGHVICHLCKKVIAI